MALTDYVEKDDLLAAAEDCARSIAEKVLIKGLEKYAASTPNVYDDAAIQLAKGFLMSIIDDIHKDPEPAA